MKLPSLGSGKIYSYRVGLNYLWESTLYLLEGALYSLELFTWTFLTAVPLSLLVAGLYRFVKLSRPVIHTYTWFFRGTPLMLQLFFLLFGLPAIGISLDRYWVAAIGFSVNYTAYFVEILRAGLESLPADQEESAFVMGASQAYTFTRVLLPQAVRIQLPVITNEAITLIKDTALVTVIAISDLLRKVREIVSRDFTISPFLLAATFYLIISYLIVRFIRVIEQKFVY